MYKKSACGAGGAGYSCIPAGRAVKRAHQWKSPTISAYDQQTWCVDEAVDRGIANPETPLFWISTRLKEGRGSVPGAILLSTMWTIDRAEFQSTRGGGPELAREPQGPAPLLQDGDDD